MLFQKTETRKRHGTMFLGSMILCLILILANTNKVNAIQHDPSDEDLFAFLDISSLHYLGHEHILDTVVEDLVLRNIITDLYNEYEELEIEKNGLSEKIPAKKLDEDMIDQGLNMITGELEDQLITYSSLVLLASPVIGEIVIASLMAKDMFDFVDAWMIYEIDKNFLKNQIRLCLDEVAKKTNQKFDYNKFMISMPYYQSDTNGNLTAYKIAVEIHDEIWNSKLCYGYLSKIHCNDETLEEILRMPRGEAYVNAVNSLIIPRNEQITPKYVKLLTIQAWDIAYTKFIAEEYRQALKTITLDLIYPKQSKLELASSLSITPLKPEYELGDTLEARFSIKNTGNGNAEIEEICVGTGGSSPEDFTKHYNIVLAPNQTYNYSGSYRIGKTGTIWFTCAIKEKKGFR